VEQLEPPADAIAGAGSTTVANGLAPGGETLALATLVVTRTDEGFLNATTLSLLDRATGGRVEIWRNLPTAPDLEPPAAAPAQDHRVDLRRTRTGHSRYWRVSPAAWAPDGSRLAFTGCGVALAAPAEQGCGLWIATGDGGDLRLVPGTAGAEGVEDSRQGARFAPDGSQLAFLRLQRGDQPGFEIWTWATDGRAAPERLGRGTAPGWRP
jgi:hypothetical protein